MGEVSSTVLFWLFIAIVTVVVVLANLAQGLRHLHYQWDSSVRRLAVVFNIYKQVTLLIFALLNLLIGVTALLSQMRGSYEPEPPTTMGALIQWSLLGGEVMICVFSILLRLEPRLLIRLIDKQASTVQ